MNSKSPEKSAITIGMVFVSEEKAVNLAMLGFKRKHQKAQPEQAQAAAGHQPVIRVMAVPGSPEAPVGISTGAWGFRGHMCPSQEQTKPVQEEKTPEQSLSMQCRVFHLSEGETNMQEETEDRTKAEFHI